MLEIATAALKPEVTITVPGSKSYTHRAFVAAALSCGPCVIENPLISEDTSYTLEALRNFGVACRAETGRVLIEGCGGRLEPFKNEIYLGNSGTSMRLLIALAALGSRPCVLTGSRRMCRRPVGPLLDALGQLGGEAVSLERPGCPPVRVQGGLRRCGQVRIDCGVSSQFLSALLLIAPYLEGETTLEVVKGPVSKPYVDLTIRIMENFGIEIQRRGYTWFRINGPRVYGAGDYKVPPDMSQAGYFWAAAALTGIRVTVAGATMAGGQGDTRLVDLLVQMGCRKEVEGDGISLTGGPLEAIEADMGDMPDMVPTLAVVSAFARGTTRLFNVGHLRAKESDRLAAVTEGLARMGIEARADGSCLEIRGGKPRPAVIDPYDDHRIAMSFAVAGLRVAGVKIAAENCVAKSFPGFWKVLGQLYR